MIVLIILLVIAALYFVDKSWYVVAALSALIAFLVYRSVSKFSNAVHDADQQDEVDRIAAMEQAKREAEELKRQKKQVLQDQLKKPIDPPKAQRGYSLMYFYPDVAFSVPPECENAARAVPPHKKLTLSYGDNDIDVLLSYDGQTIGSMYDNNLRQMVHDYDRDNDHEMLAASCYWTDKPIFSLAFYLSVKYIEGVWENNENFKKCTLVGNTNEVMQENIDCLVVGDHVSVEWDDETERYAAFDSGNCVGYLPSKLNDYAEAHSLNALVLTISEKENGKKTVQIMMIPA